MKKTLRWIVLGAIPTAVAGCSQTPATLQVASPDGSIEVSFELAEGTPFYRIDRGGQAVLENSRLGFAFRDQEPLDGGLEVLSYGETNYDNTWEQVWGEKHQIRNHYNELRVALRESAAPRRRLDVVFRAYDDGVGFRYEFPEQDALADFVITDELTEFRFAGDHAAWWIPAYQDNRYEYLYQRNPISELDVVHTPVTFETSDGLVLSLHEAALTDYASMTARHTEGTTLKCDLVPWPDGAKVLGSAPMKTPWRTLQIGESASDLLESYLILNLNEPNKLEDTSWIKPGKYVGIWWGMHLGTMSWESGPKHGATTERTKQYIDFAAEHGFDGVLVEGWNVGWDGDWMQNSELFRFTEPYPDFDLRAVTDYAREKGVVLIGHHETSAGISNYESQIDAAFDLYQELGVTMIKTGYVGTRTEGGEHWHHGQFMVRHYRMVVEKAAEHGIMLDVHEPIKPTGIRRTYPNMMTREGARGQEYNAWSVEGGNPPDHTTILPFTRMLAGPFDYTPGVLDLTFEDINPNARVKNTLAKELALYVVIYSPLHMAADLIENYQDQPAFKFIKDVPTDWEDTRALHAKIGDHVGIARKDRNSDDWYVGSITDEEARTFEVPLDFLDPGRKYVAEIYADGEGANWESAPYAINITQVLVDSSTTYTLNLAPGGGAALRLRPASEEETQSVPAYE
ncbi:MAG TPA: glycoside hydrolase family 97 protein [Acidobacteriota bacterium]|nr:glycoside hydrolase family 97 protein [Acidobacteriota bacterium]